MQGQLPTGPAKVVKFVVLKSLHEDRLDLTIIRRRYPFDSQYFLLFKECDRENRRLYDHRRDRVEV
jgi:hypothetical protein